MCRQNQAPRPGRWFVGCRRQTEVDEVARNWWRDRTVGQSAGDELLSAGDRLEGGKPRAAGAMQARFPGSQLQGNTTGALIRRERRRGLLGQGTRHARRDRSQRRRRRLRPGLEPLLPPKVFISPAPCHVVNFLDDQRRVGIGWMAGWAHGRRRPRFRRTPPLIRSAWSASVRCRRDLSRGTLRRRITRFNHVMGTLSAGRAEATAEPRRSCRPAPPAARSFAFLVAITSGEPPCR